MKAVVKNEVMYQGSWCQPGEILTATQEQDVETLKGYLRKDMVAKVDEPKKKPTAKVPEAPAVRPRLDPSKYNTRRMEAK